MVSFETLLVKTFSLFFFFLHALEFCVHGVLVLETEGNERLSAMVSGVLDIMLCKNQI